MGIKELYSKKTKAQLELAACFVFAPDPVVIVERIYKVISIDNQIKKAVLEKEEQPIVVVCSKDCKDNQGNS